MVAGIGGALRHGINVLALRLLSSGFPAGTLIVNIAGSLIMGLLIGWFAHRADSGQSWRLFLTTGILGGFTTFSTFSLDVVLLYERGQLWTAALYAAASVALAILSLFAGLFIIRKPELRTTHETHPSVLAVLGAGLGRLCRAHRDLRQKAQTSRLRPPAQLQLI